MAAMSNDRIASLNTTAFSDADIVNLILQRSEIIRDQERPNRYIKSWTQGDSAPILELVDKLGADELVKRASAFIYLEYLELKPIFDKSPPTKVADIGCGYALFDLFLAQDFGSDLVLIDLERNEHRHFGFQDEGAAYSDMNVAREFLIENGLKDAAITTLNPESADLGKVRDVDFAFSFISCGYHYPWQTYQGFFETAVRKGGSVILDIRRRKSPAAQADMAALGSVCVVEQAAEGSADRIMVRIGA
ncbi:MAG: class I SAM-dependent methyltransferase [Paracoccaceae bacterium]